jgi:hypothetical protein
MPNCISAAQVAHPQTGKHMMLDLRSVRRQERLDLGRG